MLQDESWHQNFLDGVEDFPEEADLFGTEL
jgi:hypothetical protein